MLVTPSDLSAHLGDDAWVIIDCRHDLADHSRGFQAYAQGHVPGAYFARVEDDLSGPKTGANGRHPLPDPAAFAGFLGRCGVGPGSTVVAYDDVGGQYAARLWWLAGWIGFDGVRLLDGGWPRWQAEGRAASKETPVPGAGQLEARPRPGRIADVDEVRRVAGGPEFVVLDARSAERYRGEVEPIDRIAGRIPGARNRFFKENLRTDLTFRPPEELRAGFVPLLPPSGPRGVIHQCGSGVTACVNLFAMEYAGLEGSRLYPGSWSEWIADASRPVARGP
jgi:thiosulfate/3-mercaptopyruvate sulfurtransferase